ncbi:glycosyl transferase family 1 [Burkholderia savannae]|uniref:Glycosyl transferase family 1 n=1 Tax=Burkholderia savannae TaxID=1637837 RepID=A0ABR5TF96_9BURK|nr:glycosyltransferase family 4 protein [Burkholderia savannae]KWZ43671.1 glycosyl transferase family 1 [Burkholderia savannae]
MKIGLSCNAFRYGGGLERYAIDLAHGLADVGFRPAVFARSFDPSVPEYGRVEPHRINVSFLPGKCRDAWFSWRLRVARRASPVDVLIGCNRVDSSEIAICGGTHLGFLDALGRTPTFFDRRQIALERRQYERARFVVAHSVLMRDELRRFYGLGDDKIRVLFPPVDAARFAPVGAARRAELRRRFGFADDEIVLLFPSSSHERKGLPLIEAVLRDGGPPVVVAVAGRPPERTSQRLRYVGYVKDIEDGYRAADFTILASKYEPFGLVGIESVMCGTPVILSSNIGCCDAIAPSAKLVFTPGDAAGLRATLGDAVQRARAGAAHVESSAAAHAAIRYDSSVARHVEQLLDLAAETGGRGRDEPR